MKQRHAAWDVAIGLSVIGLLALAGAGVPAGAQEVGDGPRVERIVMARAIERHRPTGEATSFAAGSGRVYAWMQIDNPARAASAVVMKWQRPGGRVPGRGARLAIPATRRYSTFAFLMPRQVGTWTVIVETEAGVELARQTFEVTAAE